MGTLSPIHWLLVILVLVLLFGSKKIPDLAKSLGQGIKEFKKATQEGEKDAPAKVLPASKTDTIEQKTSPAAIDQQAAVKKEEPAA